MQKDEARDIIDLQESIVDKSIKYAHWGRELEKAKQEFYTYLDKLLLIKDAKETN